MGQIPFFFDPKKKEPAKAAEPVAPAAPPPAAAPAPAPVAAPAPAPIAPPVPAKAVKAPPEKPLVITVTELQKRLRGDLEERYATVYVGGEISNFKLNARSGHAYFTLKDENAQVNCVMFRDSIARTRHRLHDGMELICRGKITVYEASGQLQLNVQAVEPTGLGARQLEYKERVDKLRKEGLTADARKRKIPAYPRTIGVVTSKEGAAWRDILRTILRRDPFAHVVVSFAQVQGQGAAGDVVRALRVLDESKRCDVILLCRGGGSIEDLWCFNEEIVARTIAISSVPIVTGIGHETDTTIADLVADLRVSTPTAAAEHVTPVRSELRLALAQKEARLSRALSLRVQTLGGRLSRVSARLRDPRAMIERRAQRVDELANRIERALRQRVRTSTSRLVQLENRLARLDPARRMLENTQALDELSLRLQHALRQRILRDHQALAKLEHRFARVPPSALLRSTAHRLDTLAARANAAIARRLERDRHRFEVALRDLEARSPIAILSRGYSLVFDERGQLVKRAASVSEGDRLSVRLAEGGLRVRVVGEDG